MNEIVAMTEPVLEAAMPQAPMDQRKIRAEQIWAIFFLVLIPLAEIVWFALIGYGAFKLIMWLFR